MPRISLVASRQAPRIGVTFGVSLLLVAAIGCTTSKDSEEASSSTTSEVPTTVAGTEATGTPVKIGFVNAGSGATALPEIAEGAEIGAERINTYEDGINGHPIELVVCSTDGTPESSAACANDLVADGVVAVIDSADLGTDAKIPILRGAGIATIGTSTLGTSQSLNPEAFFFSPPATTYPEAEVDLAADLGAKKLTLLFPDVPQVPVLTDIANSQAELNGISLNVVKFDPAAPDFDAALATISADGSDAIATISTDDWCTGIVRAARAVDFKGPLILGACGRFADELGEGEAAGTYLLGSTWSPRSMEYAPPEAVEVIDQYLAAMDAAGKSEEARSLAFGGYVGVWQAANALRTVQGEITAASVMSAMRTLKDLPNALGETITCDPRPYPGFSGCTKGWLQFEVQSDGTVKPLSDEFVPPRS